MIQCFWTWYRHKYRINRKSPDMPSLLLRNLGGNIRELHPQSTANWPTWRISDFVYWFSWIISFQKFKDILLVFLYSRDERRAYFSWNILLHWSSPSYDITLYQTLSMTVENLDKGWSVTGSRVLCQSNLFHYLSKFLLIISLFSCTSHYS